MNAPEQREIACRATRLAQATSKPIRLFWSGGRNNRVNFGDSLSPKLVEILSSRPVVYSGVSGCELLAVGSIIERYASRTWRRRVSMNNRPVSIWGSGTISAGGPIDLSRARVFSVRGALTRGRMNLNSSTPLGDPGLLVDLLLPNKRPGKAYRWGIIPHVSDRFNPAVDRLVEKTRGVIAIDLSNPDLGLVVRQIASCNFIASSSLHGLIAADALGIPNIRLIFGSGLRGGNWKFDDYASSIPDRTIPAKEVNSTLNLEVEERGLSFGYGKHLGDLKAQIIASFPRRVFD